MMINMYGAVCEERYRNPDDWLTVQDLFELLSDLPEEARRVMALESRDGDGSYFRVTRRCVELTRDLTTLRIEGWF